MVHPSARGHPNQSKAAIIGAALRGYDATAFSRVEAKLMYRRDLQRAAKELDGTSPDESPDDLIWVVSVSGNYGISPSFGCCSVPGDYHGHNTWGRLSLLMLPARPTPTSLAFPIAVIGRPSSMVCRILLRPEVGQAVTAMHISSIFAAGSDRRRTSRSAIAG